MAKYINLPCKTAVPQLSLKGSISQWISKFIFPWAEYKFCMNSIHLAIKPIVNTLHPPFPPSPPQKKLNITSIQDVHYCIQLHCPSSDVGCWSVSFSPRGYINRWPPGTYKQLIPTSTVISSIWSTFYIYQTSKGLLPCHLEIREVIQSDRSNRTHRNQW